jgi:hypothetical protein
MLGWNWVQQHRWLSVIVLVIVVLTTAGGTCWALVFRTTATPVSLRDALRIYRRENSGRVISAIRSRLPVPGVYTYRTTGGESLSLLGQRRSFPARTTMIVDDGTCATVTWDPIAQHTELTSVCPSEPGALSVTRLVTHETIGGATTTATIDCPSTIYLVPPSGRPGQRWHGSCTQISPAQRIRAQGVDLGLTTIDVDGTRQAVEHTRLTLTFKGQEHGTNPTDYWVSPATGLILREKETVTMTQSGVHYLETMDTTLTSLTPAR